MVSGIIFDLFGTLVDISASRIEQEISEMATSLSIPVEVFRPLWYESYSASESDADLTIERNIRRICDVLGVTVNPQPVQAIVGNWITFQHRLLTPRPDATTTLSHLKAMGIKLGLISNCPPEVPPLWQQTPFSSLFDTACFSPLTGLRKPDPRAYLLACDRLGAAPQNCVFVGDGGSRELSGAAGVGMRAVMIRAVDEDPYNDQGLGREDWTGDRISSLSELIAVVEFLNEAAAASK